MVALAVVALVHSLAIAGFSLALALTIDGVISGWSAETIRQAVIAGVVALALRAISLAAIDALAHRGGAKVKSQLRQAALARLAELGPEFMQRRASAEVTTLLARGVDQLDAYFGKYLPQLALTAIQVPVLLVILWSADIPTGIAITVALPIIPLFMVLIGWATQSVQSAQWSALQQLGRGFLDIVDGLSTLKIFDRHWRQVSRLREVTNEFRRRTMKVLRLSFLSSFVLELAASLSVAIVAVSVGIRLIDGTLPLWLGLFVLILVPELYLPLRQVGAQFHNAQEGLEAANGLFDIIEQAPTQSPETEQQKPFQTEQSGLVLDNYQAFRSGRAVHEPLSVECRSGEITVIEGPSGAGKSSLVDALLGFAAHSGTASLAAAEPSDASLRHHIAWVPQRPSLLAGSLATNVTLGSGPLDDSRLDWAMSAAGLPDLSPSVVLGVNGAGLSGGQSQRVAFARALYRLETANCPLLICDELTSALDDDSEDVVWSTLRTIADRGTIVILISHRLRLTSRADQVITMSPLRAHEGASR